MAFSLATKFPFNNGDAAPTLTNGSLDPSSRLADLADVNLRRELITTVYTTAARPKVTINAQANESVNFVSIIGASQAGQATVKVNPSGGGTPLNGAAGTNVDIVAGNPAHVLFDETYATARSIEVEFAQVPVGSRLECALIIAGELKVMQVQPNTIRRRFGQLRLERAAPQGSQIPPASRGIYRMLDLIWTELVAPDRDTLRDFLTGVNEHGTVVANDTARTDAPLYGYINGPLDLTDRRFSDFSDARLPIEEIIVSA